MRLLLVLILLSFFSQSYPGDKEIFDGALQFYQSWVSPARGFSCPMYPSCSEYSKIAFLKKDPFSAFFLTIDRLNRCGHDVHQYVPLLATNMQSTLRYYDPVDSVDPVPALFYRTDELSWLSLRPYGSLIAVNHSITDSTEESKLFYFILRLYEAKEYDKASVEELRFLSYYPTSALREKIIALYLRTLIHLNDFEKLKATGLYYTREYTNANLMTSYLLGVGAYQSKNYSQTKHYLGNLINNTNDLNHSKALLYEGASAAKLYNWDKSIEYFSQVPSGSPERLKANEFIDLSVKGKNINLKSPFIAGVLGIIPGLGYLYDGYPITALSAFLVNGLLIGSSWWFSAEQNYFMFYLMSSVSVSWYVGNIVGSITAAEKANQVLLETHANLFRLDLEF